MKIAHCVNINIDGTGGVEAHIIRLCEAMARQGIHLDIYAASETESCRALKDFDYRQYDIMHTHAGMSWPAYHKHKLLRHKIKHVHTLHGVSMDYLIACKAYLNWRCYYSTCMEGLMAHQADHTICVCADVVRLAKRWLLMPERKMSIVFNAQNPNSTAINQRQRIRDKYNIKADDIAVIFVGRGYDPVKGTPEIEAAFDKLYPKYPNLKLLAMPGSGFNNQPWLIKSGDVKNDQMAFYYAAADIALNASLSESHALAVIEPMGQGLAIIAAAVGGIPETIIHEHNGLLLNNKRSDIAENLQRLINDTPLQNKLAQNAMVDSQKYTWEISAKKTIAIYESL
ncbi:MAG: glycosyltransferase family 4 protein [Phycisphaerae bacterium]|nr:glycosyltransferase family 4 protein [Phycisphaerae bacterium]